MVYIRILKFDEGIHEDCKCCSLQVGTEVIVAPYLRKIEMNAWKPVTLRVQVRCM